MKIIKFDARIYPESILNKAISDYGKLSTIIYTKIRQNYVCCFVNCIYDEDETILEFGNYMIDLMGS